MAVLDIDNGWLVGSLAEKCIFHVSFIVFSYALCWFSFPGFIYFGMKRTATAPPLESIKKNATLVKR